MVFPLARTVQCETDNEWTMAGRRNEVTTLCAHFIQSKGRLARVKKFMFTYPQIYFLSDEIAQPDITSTYSTGMNVS